jgi:hypothetical protein
VFGNSRAPGNSIRGVVFWVRSCSACKAAAASVRCCAKCILS